MYLLLTEAFKKICGWC